MPFLLGKLGALSLPTLQTWMESRQTQVACALSEALFLEIICILEDLQRVWL